MAAVAQRLVLALSATAELDEHPPAKIELPAVLIEQFKITFDVNAAVALDGYFCWHVESPSQFKPCTGESGISV